MSAGGTRTGPAQHEVGPAPFGGAGQNHPGTGHEARPPVVTLSRYGALQATLPCEQYAPAGAPGWFCDGKFQICAEAPAETPSAVTAIAANTARRFLICASSRSLFDYAFFRSPITGR